MSNRVYEVALKSPGLSDSVKLEMRMSKLDLIFFVRAVDYALGLEIKKDSELLSELTAETREGLKKTRSELLSKAGLMDFYEELVKVGV